MLRLFAKSSNAGFSLIEVLIALLVLSIGLIGFASMLVGGMRFNQGSHIRSQASFLAMDMADRIRANNGGAEAGAYDGITGTETDPGCIITGCDTNQLAVYDGFEWGANINALLPGGSGTVVRNAATNVYTVTVNWNESDSNSLTGFVTRNIAMSVVP